MKKLLLALIVGFGAWAFPVEAEAQAWSAVCTTSQSDCEAFGQLVEPDGTAITGFTETNITLNWFKDGVFSESEACDNDTDDTDHDCYGNDTNSVGEFRVEVAADKINQTYGTTTFCVDYTTTQAMPLCYSILVMASASADNTLGGMAATTGDIADAVWDEDVVTAHDTANSAGLLLEDIESDTSAILIDTTALFTLESNVAKPWLVGPFVSDSDYVNAVTTGTPDCDITIDDEDTYVEMDNVESAVGSTGLALITISAAETLATTDVMAITCTLTDALPITTIFSVQ